MKIYNPTGFSSSLTGSFSGSVKGTLTATGNILPVSDQAFDLGSSDKRFRDIYLSSASIYLGNTVITEDNVVTTASLASTLPAGVISSSAQIASDISGSFTSVSSSLASRISSNEGSVSSLNQASSSYLLNTSDTLVGDLTVTGTLTAQDLHVQEVTSSIVYSSGSNIFGSSTSDTQTFNGGVGIGITPYSTAQLSINSGTRDYILYGQSSDANAFISLRDNSSSSNVIFGAVGNNHVFMKDTTEHMRIDSSGRVGIGVEPSTWTFNVLQIKNSSVWTTGNDLGLSANSYYDGSNYRYIGAAATSRIYHNTDGSINFSNAPTGTAGAIATFSERMKVNADGSVTFNQGATAIPAGGISHYTNNYLYIKGGTAGGALGNDNFSSAFYALDNGDANIIAGSSNALVVKASGNIGIGTTDPQAVLHLHGNTQAWTTSPTIVMSSSNTGNANVRNWRIGPADTNFGNFHIGVSDAQGGIVDSDAEASTFTIDYIGKVGIGTISPEQKLHVEGRGVFDSGVSSDIIQFRNDNGGFVIGNTTNLASIDLSSTSNLRIRQGSTVPFYLNSNGNLGIGTANPTAKLKVEGDAIITNALTVKSNGSSRALYLIQNANNAGNIIQFKDESEQDIWELVGRENTFYIYNTNGTNYGALSINPVNNNMWINPGTGFLNDSGYNLRVEGTFNATSTAVFNGSVGIGTTSPTKRLEIKTSTLAGQGGTVRINRGADRATHQGYYIVESDSYTDELYMGVGANTGDAIIGANHGKLTFQTGTYSPRLTILSDGRVGINKTNPDYTLDVEGAAAFTDQILARAGGGSIANADYVWQGKFTGNGSFIHLKTNIGWGGTTQMYLLHFYGYAYGSAAPIDAQIGFYNYPPSSAPINIGSSGTHTIVLYQSSDGYIVVRIQFTNSYFTGLTMSARNTAQGVTWPTITATAQNGTSNHF